jgi:colicin import membrane protein
MAGFLREHPSAVVFSVLLHGLLAAALLFGALISVRHTPPTNQPLPIDAVVVDSQVLRAAQRAVADEDAAHARAAAEQQAAAAAAVQAQNEAKEAEQATRAANEAARVAAEDKAAAAERLASEQKAVAAERAAEEAHAADRKRAADAKRAQEAKREADAKAAEDAKRAAEARQAEDAKRAADQAKSDREAELRRQLAAEERANAVQSSPLRDQYIARLQSRIQNAWIRPPSASVGLDCLVEVTQSPGGEVLDAHVTQCNGDAATSESIKNAAYRASPLPTPPDPALFARTFAFHFHPDQ